MNSIRRVPPIRAVRGEREPLRLKRWSDCSSDRAIDGLGVHVDRRLTRVYFFFFVFFADFFLDPFFLIIAGLQVGYFLFFITTVPLTTIASAVYCAHGPSSVSMRGSFLRIAIPMRVSAAS